MDGRIPKFMALLKEEDGRIKDFALPFDYVRLAHQKLIFFTTPEEYRSMKWDLLSALMEEYANSPEKRVRENISLFLLWWADSLNSPVELDHNLRRRELHGDSILLEDEIRSEEIVSALSRLSSVDYGKTEGEILSYLRNYTYSVNSARQNNLFREWAERWKAREGRDPFGSYGDFIEHRKELFRSCYYTDLYFSWRSGKTITQFFNDYGEQADDCRKIGSLGGTTNPVIATFGEDDLPGKWALARRMIAEAQVSDGFPDDVAATTFTELVVTNAMIGLRSIFLLEGLGRVSFQLRPDKHDDIEYLLREGPEIYMRLCRRMKAVDDILLDGANELYVKVAGERIGLSNNHFKVSITGPVGLRVLKEFNAGNNRYGLRLFTNATVTHDLPQIFASIESTMEGIREWEEKTGKEAIEGEGGSVVTSMLGRFVDGKRLDRIEWLLSHLDEDDPLREEIGSRLSSIRSLEDPPLSSKEFIEKLREKGVDFDPKSEEDAVRAFAVILTKAATMAAIKKYGEKRGNRVLSAAKRFFQQNIDLENEHRYSTDFGDIQAQCLDYRYSPREERFEGFDWETCLPVEDEGNIWWRRLSVIRRMFPDADKYLKPDGIRPEDYMKERYTKATITQFISKWELNVARAGICLRLLKGGYRGKEGFKAFAREYFGHLEDAEAKSMEFARAFLGMDPSDLGW
jgi:hypothetical protein